MAENRISFEQRKFILEKPHNMEEDHVYLPRLMVLCSLFLFVCLL